MVFGSGSAITLVLRIIVVIVFALTVQKYKAEVSDYHDCVDKEEATDDRDFGTGLTGDSCTAHSGCDDGYYCLYNQTCYYCPDPDYAYYDAHYYTCMYGDDYTSDDLDDWLDNSHYRPIGDYCPFRCGGRSWCMEKKLTLGSPGIQLFAANGLTVGCVIQGLWMLLSFLGMVFSYKAFKAEDSAPDVTPMAVAPTATATGQQVVMVAATPAGQPAEEVKPIGGPTGAVVVVA